MDHGSQFLLITFSRVEINVMRQKNNNDTKLLFE